jgi:predicted  nucleic acid-binding Zn-ribbon protein
MDAAILHERLAAAEGAIIAIDERLDKAGEPDEVPIIQATLLAEGARITALEEALAECRNEIAQSQAQIAEAMARTAEAEATEAEARADEAEALVAMTSEPSTLEETEEMALSEVEEIPSEPAESAAPERKSNWLENLFVLR